MDKDYEEYLKSSGIYEIACRDFIDNHKNTMEDIAEAVEAYDFKTAHFHAQSLKGRAGILGEEILAELARELEEALLEDVFLENIMQKLSKELERVLVITETHGHAQELPINTDMDTVHAQDVFDKLIPLLEARSFDAVNMIGELSEIPQTMTLISQIEAVDFDKAIKTVINLRKSMEV